MKPIIGVNMDVKGGKPPNASIQCTYFESIQKAGGIPILLPPMPDSDLDELLKHVHGLMLIGGMDYSASKYGEEQSELAELIDPTREEFDFRLIDRAINRTDLPILGVCLGAQLINVALGGTLIQDIGTHLPDSKVQHQTQDGWKNGFNKHPVNLESDSYLAKIYKMKRLNVPTSHHQAVKDVAPGLTAAAYADDGIVEAVELRGRPFTIGVQWHPERDYEGNKELFLQFIQAAGGANMTKAVSVQTQSKAAL